MHHARIIQTGIAVWLHFDAPDLPVIEVAASPARGAGLGHLEITVDRLTSLAFYGYADQLKAVISSLSAQLAAIDAFDGVGAVTP